MERHVRVLIADDHERSRDGLRALLTSYPEIEVVGEASNGREAVEMVDDSRPDVVLMDVRMPVMDGLEATRVIKINWPTVRAVTISMYPSSRAAALAAGADAFVLKGQPTDELVAAIEADGQSDGRCAGRRRSFIQGGPEDGC